MIVDFRRKLSRGITLTEILIAIMILGVGLVSLATLFPIGLLRLRDASRYTRTKYLTDSAASDAAARGLFNPLSFGAADLLNLQYNLPPWWWNLGATPPHNWSPLNQDSAFYGDDPSDPANPGATSGASGGYGVPFAYDPLWRYQTVSTMNATNGYYIGDTFEARFGSGIGFIRPDPTAASTGSNLPSAHGLQRITNFNRPAIMPSALAIPNIFVSTEDVVWGENLASNQFSPVLPDLTLPSGATTTTFAPATPVVNDWHYSWMFTGYQVSSSGGAQFEGNIVIFENRPFAIDPVPNPPGPGIPTGTYRIEGETVVEAIFGHSGNVVGGYGAGADRTVLLRWYSTQADPVVRAGDWIADVTYERQQLVVYNPMSNAGRFLNVPGFPNSTSPAPPFGVPNPFNNGEWDNLPAQRCFWYQVQKVTQPIDDIYTANNPPLRSMVVTVDRTLEARTLLTAAGTPVAFNAALISPYVVNVIPQQFTVRLSQ